MKANPGINILGVNQIGSESANDENCEGRDIPWLQETVVDQVWIPWEVNYRDVVILNQSNQRVAVFNLTTYDLGVTANYDSLRTLLLQQVE